MPTATRAKKTVVPRSAENPIEFLIGAGWTESQLAAAWNLKTSNTVYRLRRFNHIPKHQTAHEMAKTFGWGSAGVVIDFYRAKVAA